MPPGFRVEVVLTGPPGHVEIEHENHRIILHGWAECIVQTFHDGDEI